jgi:hypothetical protein
MPIYAVSVTVEMFLRADSASEAVEDGVLCITEHKSIAFERLVKGARITSINAYEQAEE